MYKLVNAQKMHKEYPETFQIPTQKELDSIKIGDCVKLCFNDKERMWVDVTYRNGDEFKGTLANVPIFEEELGIKYGDLITFKTENIYSIYLERI